MNGRKQRRAGCLLFLLLMVVLPSLLVSRELRRQRLSAQFLAAIKDIQAVSDINHDPDDDKGQRRREKLKTRILNAETTAVRLLQAGADPDVRDFATVKRTFWEEAKFLLKRMFRHSSASASLSPSALAMAVQADDAVIVTALLNAGANDVNAYLETNGNDSRFPLVNYGAYSGNLEIVKELCVHRADIHRLSHNSIPQGEPILQSTLEGSNQYRSYMHKVTDLSEILDRRRRTEIFHLLLAKGARYEANSKEGYELLSAATAGDFLEVTREMLAAGVPPNASPKWLDNSPDNTPLANAVNTDDIPLVKLLLQYGADTRDVHSESPILSARSPKMAALLLAHGADIHAVRQGGKRSGENVLNFACITGETKMVSFWIEHGLAVNTGGENSSPIDEAAQYGNVESVRILLGVFRFL